MAGNISDYAENIMLNYILRGGSGAPAAWGVGLSEGSPTDANASELPVASGYVRQTVSFVLATSGTATNAAAITFSSAAASFSVLGMQLWDSAATSTGSMLWRGTLAASKIVTNGDALVFAIGAISITLD